MKQKLTRKHIYFIVATVILTLTFVIDYYTRKPDYDEMKQKGVLRVATDYNMVNYFLDGDSVKGFQYELVNALCDSLGFDVEWIVENDLNKNISDLNDGKIDIIARNIPITVDLREQVAFSLPIINTKQVLVQRKAKYNDDIPVLRNQLFLAKKTIYVPLNSPSILRLENLETEIADTIYIKEMPDYEAEQLMMMVAKGDIDFAVCDVQTAKINAELLPEIDIETPISFTQMQSWAMRPSSYLLKAKIDTFLTRFLKTREYRDIYRKYYK